MVGASNIQIRLYTGNKWSAAALPVAAERGTTLEVQHLLYNSVCKNKQHLAPISSEFQLKPECSYT
jgi:hypothetical protein